jgi:RimJ/RimL family protein N-acetyltransferase
MFARTARLMLRPGWREDAPALVAALADGSVARNTSQIPASYGLDDAEAFLARPFDPLAPDLLVFARGRGTPRLIGGCGLVRGVDERLELGYWIARPYWGLGFATEAARAVLAMARATRRRDVIAAHFVDNPASGRVLRKLGFRETGEVAPRHSRARGEAVMAATFALAGEVDRRSDDVARELYTDEPALAA